MSLPRYAVYGASGCGRGVMPLARAQLQALGLAPGQLVFIDDHCAMPELNGHPVLSYRAFLRLEASERHVAIAIANPSTRERIAIKLAGDGVQPWSVRAANVVSMDAIVLGEGAILCPFVTLTSNITVGRQFHANLYSYVEHDCVIGDFVTFAPGVHCNGNVHIGNHAYIGSGAVLRQGKPGQPLVIGQGAVVGMGAVVTRSVPAGATVVGNPARVLVK